MEAKRENDFEYHLRTIAGFLIILIGAVSGLWLAWWLSSGGDVIEVIHDVKVSLPGWTWLALKYGLSLVFGLAFMSIFIVLGALVLGGGRK